MPDTVVVIPCYNESQRLDREAFVRFAARHAEIGFTFVDDGSRDSTHRKLLELQARLPKQVVVLSLAENQGKAEAVRQGLLNALESSAQVVGFWDADLATPLELIPAMRDVFRRRDDVSLVFGSRVPLLGRRIHRKPQRRFLGRLFAWSASRLMGLRIYDTQCGAKMFRASSDFAAVVGERFTSRWVFDVEILARWLSLQQGNAAGIYEMPVDDWRDVAGSRLKTRDFLRGAADLLGIAWNYRFGRYARRAGAGGPPALPLPQSTAGEKSYESRAA
jgi:glycosyltransferase involved in cell wall biosynthesis